MSDDSLDYWIKRLNEGDAAAVERILVAYEPSLRMAVRRRLGQRLRSKFDSGDIVQSVFAAVLEKYPNGGWQFAGRPQLLAFLRRIAWRRLSDRCEKHRRAIQQEQSLAETSSRNFPQTALPRPSEVAQGHEMWERILAACTPSHREVVRLRMNGCRMSEIASRTGLHEGSVRRILYDLARRLAIGRRMGGASDDAT